MSKWTNRSGLSRVRIGGRKRYSYSSVNEVATQVKEREFSKTELFLATMKYVLAKDSCVDYVLVQEQIMFKTQKKDESDALWYVQQLVNNGYLSVKEINGAKCVSITKKACDKIRQINNAKRGYQEVLA